jgi:hypothetical protein
LQGKGLAGNQALVGLGRGGQVDGLTGHDPLALLLAD